jgi:hypothetical protein
MMSPGRVMNGVRPVFGGVTAVPRDKEVASEKGAIGEVVARR